MRYPLHTIITIAIFCGLFLIGCSDPDCETFTTLDNDITLVLQITDAVTGQPIGNHLDGEAIRLLAGISLPQLLKREWTDVDNDRSEFSVDLTPSCGLPTSQNYTLEIGSLGNVKGTIFFDRHIADEECANVCSGKFISRIDFDGTPATDYKYNDGAVRLLRIRI